MFEGVFPPAVVVEPEQLNVWKKGSNIYVELTVPVTLYTFIGEPFEVPAFTVKFDSVNKPYRITSDPVTFPSGWTWTRITRRGYPAIASFDCPTWEISEDFLGTTEFNSLDIFSPPPIQ